MVHKLSLELCGYFYALLINESLHIMTSFPGVHHVLVWVATFPCNVHYCTELNKSVYGVIVFHSHLTFLGLSILIFWAVVLSWAKQNVSRLSGVLVVPAGTAGRSTLRYVCS